MHEGKCDVCQQVQPVVFVLDLDGQRRLLCVPCWNTTGWQIEYGGWTHQLKGGFGNGGRESVYVLFDPEGHELTHVAAGNQVYADKLCVTFMEPREQFYARMKRKRK